MAKINRDMKKIYKNVDGVNLDDCDSIDYVKHALVTATQNPDRYNFAEREEQIREEENFKREDDLFRILEEYGY